MGGVGSLLALEVDLGIAVLMDGSGHRLGLGRLGFILGGGVGPGRTARIVVGWRVSFLPLKTFHRGPSLHQRPVDREVIVRQQRRDFAVGQDRRHHLARYVGRQQPVAIFGEHSGHPDWIVDPEADKPAEKQVILHLFHQLALGPDREKDLDQARPDQPLRRDRRAAKIGVERLEFGIQAGQRVVHHLPDLAKRMPGGDTLFKIDKAEQRPTCLIRPAHLHPRHCCAE